MLLNRLGLKKPRLPAGKRVYAIGDVHGEAELLARLLHDISRDSEARGSAETMLILLGDFIDRGPRAADLLRNLSQLNDPNLVILKGNHEAVLVRAYDGDEKVLAEWVRFGGASTLTGLGVPWPVVQSEDVGAILAGLRTTLQPEVVEWLDALPLWWSLGDYFFVHAGVRPGVKLMDQSDEDLLWIRNPFISGRHRYDKVIVHGHTIEPGEPPLGGYRIGVDTGAHEHGRLTALGLEADLQWLLQVDAPPIVELSLSDKIDPDAPIFPPPKSDFQTSHDEPRP